MCVHRRLIFDCVHQAWLGVSGFCELQQVYDRHKINMVCSERWTHGHETIRIQSKCDRCTERQNSDRSKLDAVKDQIKALKEQLKLIKGDTKIKEEEWLSMDSVLEKAKPAATAKGDDDSSSSSLEETPDTSVDGSQPRKEVEKNPDHRPFGLSLKIAQRKAIEAGDAQGAAVYDSMLDCMLEQRYGHGWILTRKLKKPTSTA
jgi:hypothetical protein